MENTELGKKFLLGSKERVEHARETINHCLDQLKDEEFWQVPAENCNSAGIIIQHLIGNLKQWIISGISNEKDVRTRPAEFRNGNKIPKSDLQKTFNALLDRVAHTLSGLDPTRLLDPVRIQGFDEYKMNAIYQTMTHLELHTGQLLFLTRLRRGKAYRLSWVPESTEQGA
jgi:hypothetical protein